jgi:Flp pilus assembly pilin Flp
MNNLLKRFIADEHGLETVEYAIIVGFIVAGTITAIATLGVWASTTYQYVQKTLAP